MQKYKTLADAIALAEFAHRNQVDKAGLPYIDHPKRVLEKVKAQGALPYVQMAAILHDVTEDTAFNSDILLALGIPESAVRIVRLLDRGRSEKIYDNMGDHKLLWLTRDDTINMTKDEYYYQAIAADPQATMVKLADIEDNLSPWRQVYLEQETQDRLKRKYKFALEILRPSYTSPDGFTTIRSDGFMRWFGGSND